VKKLINSAVPVYVYVCEQNFQKMFDKVWSRDKKETSYHYA